MNNSQENDLTHPDRLNALEQTGLLDSLPEEAFDRLTRLATRILDAPISLVSLVEGDRQFFKSCVGLPEPWFTGRESPLTHSFCRHVVSEAAPLVISDATQDPTIRDSLAIDEMGVIAYLGIPLFTSQGHALGSFCVIDTRPRIWTEEDIFLVTELAAWAMTEIELRRQIRLREKMEEALRELSLVDDLTGLYNRRALASFLELEAERSRRYSRPLGMVMLDLDRFKAVNDRYGHQAGDELLRRASQTIQGLVRAADRTIRYGGDEFLILMPETDGEGAHVLAGRLCAALEAGLKGVEGVEHPPTVSAGSGSMPGDAETADDLLRKVDGALYRAKRQGRNRAVAVKLNP